MKLFAPVAVLVALAASSSSPVVTAQDDPCQEAHKTQASCDADTTTGGGCTWCKCAALPSACWTKTNAAKLPAGVYLCDSGSNNSGNGSAIKNKACMTNNQEQDFKTVITDISLIMRQADASMLVAASAEKNATVKMELLLSEQALSAIGVDLVSDLGNIAAESCPECSQVNDAVERDIFALEGALQKIAPGWRGMNGFKAVVAAINAIVATVGQLCPNPGSLRAF
jgi:hypothetical protein